MKGRFYDKQVIRLASKLEIQNIDPQIQFFRHENPVSIVNW